MTEDSQGRFSPSQVKSIRWILPSLSSQSSQRLTESLPTLSHPYFSLPLVQAVWWRGGEVRGEGGESVGGERRGCVRGREWRAREWGERENWDLEVTFYMIWNYMQFYKLYFTCAWACIHILCEGSTLCGPIYPLLLTLWTIIPWSDIEEKLSKCIKYSNDSTSQTASESPASNQPFSLWGSFHSWVWRWKALSLAP